MTEEWRVTGAAGEIELKAGNMGLGRRLNLCTGNIKIEEERDRFSQEPDPEKKRDLAGAYTGKITDGQILEDIRDMALGDTEIRWSALLFEEFARDPFVFYLKRVLKLSEIEAGTIEPRALTAGSLTHEILRRFFGKLPGGDILSGEDPHAIADEVMEETFGEFRVSGEITDESFWRIKEREIKKAVHNFAAFETERMKSSLASGSAPLPSLYEFAFGGRKNPFSLKLGELPLHIHGRVDRVDLDDKGGVAAVYDYKYSASGKQMEAVRKTLIGRRRFQLGVYLLAVKRYLSNNLKWKAPFSLKAGIYLLRNNPSSPGSFYREIEFDDEIIKTLKEGIEKIVRLVISGRFDSL